MNQIVEKEKFILVHGIVEAATAKRFLNLEMLSLSFVKTETKVYKVKLGYEHKNKSKQFGSRVYYTA